MKIIYYGVQPEEEKTIQQWSFRHRIRVTIVSEVIDVINVHLAKGHQGVCLFPSQDMRTSEEIYRVLAHYQIQTIAIKSTGVDSVNFDWAKKYGLTITNVPTYSPTSVGHYAVMAILMGLRHLPQLMHQQGMPAGKEMNEVTIGLVGMGRIGQVVAETCQALGAKVIATTRTKQSGQVAGIQYVSLTQLVTQSDVVSLHLPQTKESYHLFDETVFEQLADDVVLVNTARGAIIDTQALLHWLARHPYASVVLDTLEDEEIYRMINYTDNPWYQRLSIHPQVMITPHIAYYTQRAVDEIVWTTLTNTKDVITTGKSANQVFS